MHLIVRGQLPAYLWCTPQHPLTRSKVLGQDKLCFLSIWYSPSYVPFHGRRLQTARHEMASSAVTPIRPMVVTYKAANENDRFQPEMGMSKTCVLPILRSSPHLSCLPRVPSFCHNLARESASQDNRKRPWLEKTNDVLKHPGFHGNPLAGFYLTTIGRF